MNTPRQQTSRGSVLITGVSSGIGLGMAQRFLAEGYQVLGSVRSSGRATELKGTLGDRFVPMLFDICDQRQIDEAEALVRSRLESDGLAAMINNAGSAEIGPLLHVSPETLQRHLDSLVVGQLRVIQRFFRYLSLPGKPPGRIINISSVSGVGINTHFGCYAAGKHALEGLSKTLREEVRGYGVKVVVIAPGNIATDIWPKQRAELIERYRNTDYYPALKGALAYIGSNVAQDAMTIDEFTEQLFRIFSNSSPADRYTIVKTRSLRLPLLRAQVKVTEG